MTTLLPLETLDAQRLPAPARGRFKPLRSGVQNIWQHDSVLLYRDGRMLNRGVNGTGKSIFLGLQVPFLFDGRQALAVPPVSTSGPRGTLRELLLEGRKHVSRIGYTWIEFGRTGEDGDEFVTCGAGMRASQSSAGVVTWYFVTDRRVGAGVDLFSSDGHPLDAADLRATLGRERVFDDQASYRAAVDSALFGIGPERLRRLTTILRSLSRPNLAANLDAERAGEYLTDFLDPLPEQLFDQIAEHYSKVDALAQRSHALHDHVDTMDRLLGEHREYARTVVQTLAHRLRKADSDFRAVSEERRDIESRRDAADIARTAATAAADAARREAAGQEERVRSLETSDAVRAVEALSEAEVHLDRARRRSAAARERVAQARADSAEMVGRQEQARQRVDLAGAHLRATTTAASEAAAGATLDSEHGRIAERMATERTDAARKLLDSALETRRRTTAELRRLDAAWREAERRAETARAQVRQREAELDDMQTGLAAAVARRDEALAELHAAVDAWTLACEELRVDEQGRATLAAAVEARGSLAQAVEQLAAPPRDALASARAQAEQTARDLAVQVGALEAERADIAAERDEGPPLVSGRHRREGRPGAPLWAACEFAPGVDASTQAAVEAALEAAGVLGAWVLPDGGLLTDADVDAALTAGSPVVGPTLASLLVPDGDAVPAAAVTAVLCRIGLDRLDAGLAVQSDGGYAAGPLRGRASKQQAEHIGAPARERRRSQRIADLDIRIAELGGRARRVEEDLVELARRTAALASDIAATPDESPLRDAEAAVGPARAAVEAAAERLDAARIERDAAVRASTDARGELTRRGLETGLGAWLEDLDGLAARGDAYAHAAGSWIAAAEQRRHVDGELAQRRDDAARARITLEAQLAAEDAALTEEAEFAHRHAALTEAAGESAMDVIRLLALARGERDAAARAAAQADGAREAAGNECVALEARREASLERFEAHLGVRDAAASALRETIAQGMLECAGWRSLREQMDAPAGDAAVRRLLVLARAEEMGDRPPEQGVLGRRQRDVIDALPAVYAKLVDYRVELTGTEHEPPYLVPFADHRGEVRPLRDIRELVHTDARRNDDLIDAEERRFFDDVMLSEVTTQLNEVLGAAEEQIARINRCVLERPTRRGHRVRLHWGVRPAEVPEGTRDALDLIAQHPRLHTDEGRGRLAQWLRERVADARDSEDGPLRDRLARAFDYRTWHRVEVQLQMPGSNAWERFNSRRAVLSEGERAALLHLPLFAAVATAYDNARAGAPRIFALDEAFERIDEGMRAEAFRVVCDLDLDVLMANFSMMPTYDTVKGIAIHIMSMVDGADGVGIIEMTWDGAQLVEL
ncbi:MAG TPA: TIGR02680 family protein [Candidatus Dormibacteraeota bacterium]|nr:TIGR02680 family protein [Candidatus Dormibacteraeota bacterium]